MEVIQYTRTSVHTDIMLFSFADNIVNESSMAPLPQMEYDAVQFWNKQIK